VHDLQRPVLLVGVCLQAHANRLPLRRSVEYSYGVNNQITRAHQGRIANPRPVATIK